MIRHGSPLHKKLVARDDGMCAWHGRGCDPDTHVPHHRANRGMGGYEAGDELSNLVMLCSEINGLIESDREYAEAARRRGLKISKFADPEKVPVWLPLIGWCLLRDDGSMEVTRREEHGAHS